MTFSLSTFLTVPDGTQGGSKSWSIRRCVALHRTKPFLLMCPQDLGMNCKRLRIFHGCFNPFISHIRASAIQSEE